MNITGSVVGGDDGRCTWRSASGVFYASNSSSNYGNVENTGGSSTTNKVLNFQASRKWSGATSSNGNHTHTVTVNVTKNTSIYGNSTTVQPNALKVRVKCRAK